MVCKNTTARSTMPSSGGGAGLPEFLDAVDAQPLLYRLQAYRHTGRPGYPLKALWRGYLASFFLNLPSTNALYRTLKDDAGFRVLCGFGDTWPSRDTLNRFIRRLAHHADLVEAAWARVTDALKEHLPGLGEQVAVDSTAVRTHANPNRTVPRDPEAAWGVKTSARAKVGGTEYFYGYKAHAVADAVYGVPLALVVTPGNKNDSPLLPAVMERAAAQYSWWAPAVAIGDRGYDSAANHEWLDARGVLPIIHIRKTTEKGGLRGGIYAKDGTPTCMGNVPMEYAGDDPATGKRLYICREGGCHLKDSKAGGVLYCNDEVWEDPNSNLRLFGRVRRGGPEWKAYYKRRYSIERVFKGMKESRRLERHFVRGLRMITLHAMMSALGFQATALAKVRAGDAEHMRWMVEPVA